MPPGLSANLRASFLRSVGALILREVTTSYRRSPGGYLWVVLEPLGVIAVFSVAFSLAFRTPPLGESFLLFFATGYLPFGLYSDLAQKTASAVRFSKPLLGYPVISIMDALVARFCLNLLTQLFVFLSVISVILFSEDTRAQLHFPSLLNGLAMAAGLGFGIGAVNCGLFSVFPVWERLWVILNRPLFLVSGVLFLVDNLPDPIDFYLSLNPLVHIIGEVRRGFFPGYEAKYVSVIYVYALALVCLFLGLLILHHVDRDRLVHGS